MYFFYNYKKSSAKRRLQERLAQLRRGSDESVSIPPALMTPRWSGERTQPQWSGEITGPRWSGERSQPRWSGESATIPASFHLLRNFASYKLLQNLSM
ncbi:hypothetical protein Q1695_013120 [Nippostrongylus brasiliensis]|nr:hypothetical protein Q1695_013120 [Nippostrongylus brasiliensis]